MRYLAEVAQPEELLVLDVKEFDSFRRLAYTAAQGLANRTSLGSYLLHPNPMPGITSEFWMEYYQSQYNIKVKKIIASEFMTMLKNTSIIQGLVVYDSALEAQIHIALVYAGLENLIPVHEKDLEYFMSFGFKTLRDIRKKWDNDIEANIWAAANLLPLTNQKIVGHVRAKIVADELVCPDIQMVDLYVREKAFMFCICKDKGVIFPGGSWDQKTLDAVYLHLEEFALFIGWFYWMDQGEERSFAEDSYIKNISLNNKIALCAGGFSPNFSFHSAINDAPTQKKTLPNANAVKKDGVYFSIALSDGDALWCLHNGFSGNWKSELRGKFPISWSFQPLAIEFCPGIMRYYLETATENDLLVASLSGTGYAYPSLFRNLEKFLLINNYYLEKTGFNLIMGFSDVAKNTDKWLDFGEIINDKIPHYLNSNAVHGVLEGYGPRYNPQQSWQEQLYVSNEKCWLKNIYEFEFSWFTPPTAEKIALAVNSISSANAQRPLFLGFFLGLPHGITLETIEATNKILLTAENLRSDIFFKFLNSNYGGRETA